MEGQNQEYNDKLIQEGVQSATDLGMYVIIDWYVLNYNPNEDLEEATAFFQKYATMYKEYDNVIFEVCNEPTGTAWFDGSDNDLYTYCTKMTNVIRECGSDAIIICGTDSYSSKVDEETAGAERNQADDTVSTPAERTKKRPIIPISIAVGAAVGVDVTMRNRKNGK